MKNMAPKKLAMLSVVGMLTFAGAASAALITVDPDAYAAGTDISNAFSGVTLSASGPGWSNPGTNIFSVDPSTQPAEPFNASTGSLSFGTQDGLFPHLFREPTHLHMRVDFAVQTDFVSIDFISNNGDDQGFMSVYDSLDNLLGSYTTDHLSLNQFETMAFSSASANIMYITASGLNGFSSGGLDNLQYNSPVPEPGTIALMCLGLVGLGFRRRAMA